ncbi:MAG: hypothetical protein LBS19_14475 [Clostridiales bacterium]|nr:hypothetical protein [Clostridiales bacterium]
MSVKLKHYGLLAFAVVLATLSAYFLSNTFIYGRAEVYFDERFFPGWIDGTRMWYLLVASSVSFITFFMSLRFRSQDYNLPGKRKKKSKGPGKVTLLILTAFFNLIVILAFAFVIDYLHHEGSSDYLIFDHAVSLIMHPVFCLILMQAMFFKPLKLAKLVNYC